MGPDGTVDSVGGVTDLGTAPFPLDDWFVRDLPGLYEPWAAADVAEPRLLVLNDALATDLGLDPEALRSPDGVAALVGNGLPDDVVTVAQAYAGHQFGGYSPRLGDGRALLLGELIDPEDHAAVRAWERAAHALLSVHAGDAGVLRLISKLREFQKQYLSGERDV